LTFCRLSSAAELLEIAKAVEPVQDGRIHIQKIDEPFLYKDRGTPAEYGSGLKLAIERGWLWMHENGNIREVHTRRRRVVRLTAQPLQSPAMGTNKRDHRCANFIVEIGHLPS
jgi:hypothetical protein